MGNVIAILITQLGNADGTLQAEALSFLGDARAIEPLSEVLSDRERGWKEDCGPERTVAEIAREALARLIKKRTTKSNKYSESKIKIEHY